MSNEKQVDSGRRGLLVATCAAGGVVGVSTAGVLVSTLQPSERAKAAGAPVEADIADVKPGELKVVEWRGKPVWILRRTPEMLASLPKNDSLVADPNSDKNYQMPVPAYAKNEFRAYENHKDVLVVVGICAHLCCSPSARSRLNSGAPASWSAMNRAAKVPSLMSARTSCIRALTDASITRGPDT